MAQNLWRLDVALEDLFDVRAADPASGHFDQYLVLTDFVNRHFLDPHDTPLAVDAGLHGSRDGPMVTNRFGHRSSAAHCEATSCSSCGGQPCERKESSLIK